uniref:Uncharacterized protein n=1 Tax=Arundo donax TaxID=35708 RepID=A0A0A9G7D7_ARUDO
MALASKLLTSKGCFDEFLGVRSFLESINAILPSLEAETSHGYSKAREWTGAECGTQVAAGLMSSSSETSETLNNRTAPSSPPVNSTPGRCVLAKEYALPTWTLEIMLVNSPFLISHTYASLPAVLTTVFPRGARAQTQSACMNFCTHFIWVLSQTRTVMSQEPL